MEPAHIRRCLFADLTSAPNWNALLDEYAAESAVEGLGGHCAQVKTYQAFEDAGLLHIVGAFVGETLAGFVLVLTSVLPHFGKRVGISESYFVASAYRGTGAGLGLLREAETLAAECGCIGFMASAPAGGRLDALLPMRGYRHTGQVYFKSFAVTPAGNSLARIAAMSPDAVGAAREAEAVIRTLPQVELPTAHSLHAGLYARTVTIPAGVAVAGALIKIPTLLIVSGHVEVFTGEAVREVRGYQVLEAEASRKQVFVARAETTLTMVFRTSAVTVEQAESEFTDEADALMSRRSSEVQTCPV